MPESLDNWMARMRRWIGASLLACLVLATGVPALRAAIENESCAERCCQRQKHNRACCRRKPAPNGPALAAARAECVCEPVAGLGRGDAPGSAAVQPLTAIAWLAAAPLSPAPTRPAALPLPPGPWRFGRPPPAAL